ncbi:MAG: TonB-dependent receptor [Pseudomonadales bacterium]|nr:TonB-dependent receptor [Pseudomonadales bacterium]
MAEDSLKTVTILSLQELMDVQVTVASMFTESELFLASTASRVTEAQWRRKGAEKTFEAIEHLPGIYVTDYMYGQSLPTFRGFIGNQQYNSYLTLLDGIPLNNYATSSATYGTPNFALGNLSAIEVIRGPGSALYGADAFNGVVSFETWDSEQDQVQIWAEAGNFGYRNANGRVRQTLSDNISFTGSYSYAGIDDEKNQEDYTISRTDMQVQDTIADQYRNFTSSNKLRIFNTEFSFYISDHKTDDAYSAGEIDATAVINPAIPPTADNGIHADGEGRMQAYKLSQKDLVAKGWEVDLSVFYVEDEFLGRWGAIPGEEVSSTSLVFDIEGSRYGFSGIAKKHFIEQHLKIVMGYNYDEMKTDFFNASPEPAINEKRTLHGVFAQADLRLFDDFLQILIGGRADHYSDFGKHFSPRIGLVLHPQPNQALKLLYGHAFRSPSLLEGFSNGFVQGGNEDGRELEPEDVDTYELIWQHISHRWRYSLTAYQSEVSNIINLGAPAVPFPIGAYFVQWKNLDELTSKGLELESHYIYEQWDLSANAAFNETEDASAASTGPNLTAYPKLMFNLAVLYQVMPSLTMELNHQFLRDWQTADPISTSTYQNEALADLHRSDFYVNWQAMQSTEIYFSLRDIFDRADTKADINSRERGKGTPGSKWMFGLKVIF